MSGIVENLMLSKSSSSTKLVKLRIQDPLPLLRAVTFGISVENFGGTLSGMNQS